MTYKIKNIMSFLFFFILLYLIICNSSVVSSSVIESANIFFYKVFPSIFPSFILSEFLINYNFTYYVNLLLKDIFSFLFKINPNSSYIIILSLFSGLPSNAKFINDAYESKVIDEKEATKLMTFTFFPNPLFVINTVGVILLNSFSVGVKMLLSIYLSNFILAILIRNNYVSKSSDNIIIRDTDSFSNTLKRSIDGAFKTCLIILGSITIFNVLYRIISSLFGFNIYLNSIFISFLEMTSGINIISSLDLSYDIKIILISACLSFTGLCILSQAKSMINFKINFRFIILCRFIVVLINIFIIRLII